ncbi:MAG: phosphatase PAP2 family protein [Chitinophagaceae bacterium]|nr:MAG: phosphatase PAP2 family protein [Chitinophagaceae bacterium]
MRVLKTFSIIFLFTVACNQEKTVNRADDPEVLHRNEKNLTELIIHDIFSPPVASRIYTYTSLAAHEALRHINSSEPSIDAKLKNFPEMPQPDQNKKYDFMLAASKAFYTVMFNITFSKDSVKKFEENTYASFKQNLSKEEYENSLAFGEAVGKAVMQRVATDNYKETRGMPKYIGTDEDGKWRPTAPDYLDGTEPYWSMMKSITLDSSGQFDPGPPPPFSKDTASMFYKMNKEVYETGKGLTKEQKDIAYFWDDNPFVSHHSGHMMFNTKKQTPGGHWMGITAIACRKSNADAVKTARAYALVAVGLLDGFISCWATKYQYNYIRPITIINDWIDKNWEPYLQTPPFPEYTSGHSTITGSAATILTALFGENFSFHDDADKEYIGMERDFKSFLQAAQEASVSRLYGGIHYRLSLDTGADVGKKVGNHVLKVAN